MNYILPQTFEGCTHLTMKSNSERNSIPEEVMITSCSNTDQRRRKYTSFILWRTIKVLGTASRGFSSSEFLSVPFSKFSKFTCMEAIPSF